MNELQLYALFESIHTGEMPFEIFIEIVGDETCVKEIMSWFKDVPTIH